MKLKAAKLCWPCQGLTPGAFKAVQVICVSFCGHKLTDTDFTRMFHIFTFLMSRHMGFISAFLKREFNVWCLYRCSRRSVVLWEIYCSFHKPQRLDPWFMMKAAFGPGCSDTASPPFLLAFRGYLEATPDQWWAGADEWGTSSPERLDSPAVMGTEGWQGSWPWGEVTWTQQTRADEKNGHHLSLLEAWHLVCCISFFIWCRQLGTVTFKFSFSRSTYFKSLLIIISKVTIYWGKAVATSLGYLYPSSEFGRNFSCYFGQSYSILYLMPSLEILLCLQEMENLLMWLRLTGLRGEQIHSSGEVVWYYKGE